MFESAAIVTFALLLDRLLGEPARFHPLVGYGRVAHKVELILLRGQPAAPRPCGVIGWMAMVLPILFLGLLLLLLEGWVLFVVEVVVLYLLIGGRSLTQHADRVAEALAAKDLPRAQQLGLPGALICRAANTLDAMWGYTIPRYIDFGWFSARIDDWANWIPARLTALSYALLGNWSDAMRSWREQASACKSPNGGVVMAAGAGALQIELGGEAHYNGKREQKPLLGFGPKVAAVDIGRATRLVLHTQLLWVVLLWGAVALQWISHG